MSKNNRGLHASVYKNSLGDTTNGGSSSSVDAITIVNIGCSTFAADRNAPAFRLERRGTVLRLVPVDVKPGAGPMFGGNFAYTCDSRFRIACEELLGHPFYGAVAIHDRFETAYDSGSGDGWID